ncbi:hypothetical protein AB0G67_44675 [Streptomyces sp. NPDC021056]|uniref:hypothetical protein n=1 Tax=Streptomyces sp. NPDC021056 TaxID=3155012 RepID=UPI0033D882CC
MKTSERYVAALAVSLALTYDDEGTPERCPGLDDDVVLVALTHGSVVEACGHGGSDVWTACCAPEDTHARPATKSLISRLLISGPTSMELSGPAERSGVLV